jgi:hypothetical protein
MTVEKGLRAMPCYTTPNFGARFVRIIRLSDVRAVHMRGSRQPGNLLAMLMHQREQQLKHRFRGGYCSAWGSSTSSEE